jgi:hypothetical protein
MTMLVIASSIATVGCLAGLLGRAAWLMMHPVEQTNENETVAGAFSPDRYRPMERLLLPEDLRFLESQPGYTAEIGAEWKRGRRKVFRMYLDELKRDFQRLHATARAMVAESGVESSDMVGLLIRQQFSFWRAIAMVEIRFAFSGTGFPRIDVRPVVELLNAMRLDVERFAPQSA